MYAHDHEHVRERAANHMMNVSERSLSRLNTEERDAACGCPPYYLEYCEEQSGPWNHVPCSMHGDVWTRVDTATTPFSSDQLHGQCSSCYQLHDLSSHNPSASVLTIHLSPSHVEDAASKSA